MPPDEPNDEERLEQLEEDGQTPFNAAGPSRDPDADPEDERQLEETIDSTYPATDDGIDSDELYQVGLEGAAGASEPNAGNTVTGYTKPDNSNSGKTGSQSI